MNERPDTAQTSTIVVLGMGNARLSDEGVGIDALRVPGRGRSGDRPITLDAARNFNSRPPS
jgi:hypothetical protein